MLLYELRGAEAQELVGWVKGNTAFDKLAGAGLVECPHCGPTRCAKRLMAPAIPKKGRPARNAKPDMPPPPSDRANQSGCPAGNSNDGQKASATCNTAARLVSNTHVAHAPSVVYDNRHGNK